MELMRGDERWSNRERRCERRKGLTVGQWAYFIPFCGVVSTETAVLIATTAKQLTTTGSEATQQPTTKQPQ
eukprot:scaffold13326_cov204-Alexandrium_tamarense.AAC.52